MIAHYAAHNFERNGVLDKVVILNSGLEDIDLTAIKVPFDSTLSPELWQFLSNGSPPIVFTPSIGHQHASKYFNI